MCVRCASLHLRAPVPARASQSLKPSLRLQQPGLILDPNPNGIRLHLGALSGIIGLDISYMHKYANPPMHTHSIPPSPPPLTIPQNYQFSKISAVLYAYSVTVSLPMIIYQVLQKTTSAAVISVEGEKPKPGTGEARGVGGGGGCCSGRGQELAGGESGASCQAASHIPHPSAMLQYRTHDQGPGALTHEHCR